MREVLFFRFADLKRPWCERLRWWWSYAWCGERDAFWFCSVKQGV